MACNFKISFLSLLLPPTLLLLPSYWSSEKNSRKIWNFNINITQPNNSSQFLYFLSSMSSFTPSPCEFLNFSKPPAQVLDNLRDSLDLKKKGQVLEGTSLRSYIEEASQVSHSNIRRWGTWFLLPIITPFMTFLAPGSFYPTWDQIFSTYNHHHTRNNGISSKYPLSEGGSIVPTCLSDIQDWKQLMIAYHD